MTGARDLTVLPPHNVPLTERCGHSVYTVEQVRAALFKLQAENDKLRANDARYRFLRDCGDAAWRPFAIRDGLSAEQADAKVDAAIEAAGDAGEAT